MRPGPGGHLFLHVLALVCGVLVAGCGTDAESAPEPGVRRDEKVIRQCFPELGDFEEVVWTGVYVLLYADDQLEPTHLGIFGYPGD